MNKVPVTTSLGEPAIPATPRSVSLFDLVEKEDTGTNLLGDGFLRIGHVALLVGPTGIGKSVLILQAIIAWALGLPFFGIRPARALRFLLVQSENDDRDLIEMRDGIVTRMPLSVEQQQTARDHIRVLRCFKQGAGLFADITPDVVEHRPDILALDPLFAYAGIDIARDQPGLSTFLRSLLHEFCARHSMATLLLHHTNRPPTSSRDKAISKGSDFAYAGSGHNELANFARAILVLRAIGSSTVFELRIAKRWERAGIFNSDGSRCDHFLVKHADEGIFWESATAADLERSLQHGEKAGDPVSPDQKLYAAFSSIEHDGKAPLVALAKALGMGERNARRQFECGRSVKVPRGLLSLNKGIVLFTVAP